MATAVIGSVTKAVGSVVWYVKELMGDNDYAKYCAHLQRHHPEQTPPTEREFWKQRWERQSKNPEGRCC